MIATLSDLKQINVHIPERVHINVFTRLFRITILCEQSLITNKTVEKNLHSQDHTKTFCAVFNWL